MFPEADFSGFWICHRKPNSASNDTTYVKVSICSGSNPLTPTLHVLLALAKIKESEVCLAFCLNVSYEQKIICNTI